MSNSPKPQKPDATAGLWSFMDNPGFRTIALYALTGVAVLLFVLEFTGLRYGYTVADDIPAFYILYAGVGAALVGLASAALRKLLLRGKTFYGDHGVEAEKHPVDDLGVEEHNRG